MILKIAVEKRRSHDAIAVGLSAAATPFAADYVFPRNAEKLEKGKRMLDDLKSRRFLNRNMIRVAPRESIARKVLTQRGKSVEKAVLKVQKLIGRRNMIQNVIKAKPWLVAGGLGLAAYGASKIPVKDK